MRHAAAASLLLSLAATSVRAQAAPQTLRTVQASECRQQSVIDDITFTGCTTINSPSPGQPWCWLPKDDPKDPDVKAFCNLESAPKRIARLLPSGEATPCLPTTNVPGRNGVVYGCFTTTVTGGQLKCDTGENGLQPCLTLNAAKAIETASGPSSESRFSKILPGPPTIAGLPKPAAYGIAFGLVVVLTAVGLFFFLRWRRSKRKSGKGPSDDSESYQAPSPIEVLVVEPPAAPPAVPPTFKQRSSSQYGAGAAMSFLDSAAEGPPVLPPVNIEGSLGKYLIATTYTPTLDDEIVIQPGDIVEVFQEFDDGWCSAVNITRGMTRGVFPMHCIDEAKGRLED